MVINVLFGKRTVSLMLNGMAKVDVYSLLVYEEQCTYIYIVDLQIIKGH